MTVARCSRCSELIAAHERHAKRCQASSEDLIAACHDLESQNQRLRAENHKMFVQLQVALASVASAERWKLDSVRAWTGIVYKLALLARELGEDPGDGLDTCADALVRGVERLRGGKR